MTERELERRAQRRLAVLRHVAEVSGSGATTCRYYGISRQCYYGWHRRYEADAPATTPRPVKSPRPPRCAVVADRRTVYSAKPTNVLTVAVRRHLQSSFRSAVILNQ